LKIHDIPVSKFNYVLKWKIWGEPDNESLRHSISDVLSNPQSYPADFDKILHADLSFPIISVYTPLDEFIILDGYHRLSKCILKKKKHIQTYVFTDPKLLMKFKLGKCSNALWNKIDHMSKKDLDSLYDKRFG
jgi:hypothetical protein